ncbi:hypothetical protein PLEOSDRAFT_165597 [Pleurotus ostreatus PC15]|uniref:Uncharacterized protein n=1 Tax=Pleurotus ostreatus (strain PC15) TaxID=1137138 RepID=A0A067NZK8_PLEO1|nr:hypothetical protein PLEOSDRAFT_165597 [Pleurotus ostreatus PC15]
MVFTRAQAANAEAMNTQIESSPLSSISTHESSVSDTEQEVSAGNVPQLVCSYSDVVASQSRGGFMTPRDELSLRTSESQPAKVSGAEEGISNKDGTKDLTQSIIHNDDDGPWVPVGKGGRHSPKPIGPILSPLKLAAIHQAEENLSEADRDLLARRSSSVIIINDEDSSVSQSTGIATPVPRDVPDKGKRVDPREYGEPIIKIGGPSNALQHLPVPKEELDVVAQQAELSFWDMARKSPSAPPSVSVNALHLTTGEPDIIQTPVGSVSATMYDPIAELQCRLLDLELTNSVLRAELDAVPKSVPKAAPADTQKLETPKVVPQAQKDHIRAVTAKYEGNKRVKKTPKFVENAKEESRDEGFPRSHLLDRDSIRPSSYIPKTSSVGHVLERLRRQNNDGSSSPSSSSSSSDSSDESESDSGSSVSSRH